MKLGGFGFIADYQKMRSSGYDYAELDMPEIEELSDAEFDKLCKKVEKAQFPVLCGARVLPIATSLFFVDDFNPEQLEKYLKKSCRRAGILGIKKVIFGNGKARSLSKTEDINKEPVFVDFLRMLSDIAGINGQELILEPLGPKYSNYINTIPEAVELIVKVNMPNLFTMADLRHVIGSGEPFSNLSKYSGYIHHIHIDYPLSYPERLYPCPDDDFDYAAFLEFVKKSGYDDTLTVEADVPVSWKLARSNLNKVLRGIM